jgi:maltose alpha-D-glucosyltransferase/alpha-amylase
VNAALVCRPAAALAGLLDGSGAVADLPERPLGADQSNTSVVVGERVLVKAFRRLEAGLNPELELVAFLGEEAGFPAVPPLGGFAEMVSATAGTATVAITQAFVADGADAYESVAETLVGWLLAPGEVSVEFATEVASELGSLTAGLHAALADPRGIAEFEPRPATRDEVRAWARTAQRQLVRAADVASGDAGRFLHDAAPAIAAELTVFDALSAIPLLTRVHGDYHLGQVLMAGDGYRVIDFEGEPLRPLEERRAHGSPLRDVASMLRSLDHVGRSAGRRAASRNAGPLDSPGLDLEAWLRRARERFVEAYAAGLRSAGSPIEVDPALIRAFEFEKETYEFIYASTYLPSWLWAPTEGMRGLLAGR